ncbi:MAG: hypothetical protein NTY80_04870 [candidate division SR1 bacterium]|nr:hypothetical protein [candidate division SR1 bacterium]
MKNNEIIYYPIIDDNNFIRPKIRQRTENVKVALGKSLMNISLDINKANAFLVAGGDGFMLDTMKKYYDFKKSPEENKLFLGVNCGTLGFLLNDVNQWGELPKTTEEIDIIKGYIMKVEILKKDNQKEIKYAINDVVVGGNVLDYFKFFVNGPTTKEEFYGTGVMVSSALGSTAYWLNNGGPMMSSGSDVRGISGIAALPFRPKGIRPEEITIKIKGRSPAMVGVDGYQGRVDDIEELTISPTAHYTSIAFLKDEHFNTKRMLLSQKKVLGEHI